MVFGDAEGYRIVICLHFIESHFKFGTRDDLEILKNYVTLDGQKFGLDNIVPIQNSMPCHEPNS